MIRITRAGMMPVEGAGLEELRTTFERLHHVRLPGFLASDLFDPILDRLDAAEFVERVHGRIGSNRELCMQENPTLTLLHFLVNGRDLLQAIRHVTGSAAIDGFAGRVYRMEPGGHHYDAWHDDLDDQRVAALTLNLSRRPFEGGVLQIRARGASGPLAEVANVGRGDAVLFRLAPGLQHRVTPVEGGAPKTALAGWFQTGPDFYRQLTRRPA